MAIETATPQSHVSAATEGAATEQAHELPQAPATAGASQPALVLDELLVEDVSIDGMCGVY